jgi:hypothetical protein
VSAIDVAMGSLAYIPRKSTLLVLFKAARVRLMAACENIGLLSESRLASITEEVNRLSDDIREATTGTSVHDDAALRANKLDEREAMRPRV